jgi:hypothetical protein
VREATPETLGRYGFTAPLYGFGWVSGELKGETREDAFKKPRPLKVRGRAEEEEEHKNKLWPPYFTNRTLKYNVIPNPILRQKKRANRAMFR